MPSLSQSWSEIEPALLGPTPASSRGLATEAGSETESDLFGRLVRLVFEASVDARKAGIAVEALREAGFLTPQELAQADLRELEETLRSAHSPIGPKGLRPVQRLAAWLVERGEPLESLRTASISTLRDRLREINGIGSATADTLLLFGLGLPAYPVDRATYRILARHGWIDPTVDYEEVRDLVTSAVGDQPQQLVGLSQAMERIGREFCKASIPKCERCPLRPWLPDGGPVDG